MSAAPSSVTGGPAGLAESPDARPPRPGRRRRRAAVTVVVAVALAGGAAGAAAVHGGLHSAGTGAGAGGNGYPTALASVTRGPLSSQTPESATLGYAGSYTVLNHASGTITWLPATGRVIREGQVLYRVDNGSPVFLLYGTVPAWRALSQGMTGADVRQLNAALVALRYATSSELDPSSDYFSSETAYALGLLQVHLGLDQTGTLPLGQAVFLPTALRVSAVQAELGNPAGGPVLQATSPARVVTIALDAALQSEVRTGDQVSITLPDGQVIPGRISSVGTVAKSGSSPTITVEVTPLDPSATGSLDQAPVEVSITTASVPSALAVPVDALVALAGGGYAVEEFSASGVRRLVPVSLGLFDDAAGLVQVSGTGLAAGQRIVVPAP